MPIKTTTAPTRQASQKRLGGACRACHSRKVRCSLAKSGPPCANCSLDEIECELRVRKSQKTSAAPTPSRQALPRPLNLFSDPDQREESITVVLSPKPELDTRLVTSESHSAVTGINSIGKPDNFSEDLDGTNAVASEAEVDFSERSTKPCSSIFRPFQSHFSHFEEDDALNAESLPADTPMYGDPKGVCAIGNICEPERADKSGHFLLPNGIVSSLDPEDLGYLRLKGAFVFPEARIRDELVRTYFHYVHPFFPIVDVQDFLPNHESAALDRISAHLLWSMYLAASNFLEEDVVRAAGFTTRKEMKRSIYRKAKALYDMQYERDRTTLIQAVLLMSFCSSDTEDKTGPWHWIGVAISLCQTAGLHRNPHPTASHIPQRRQRLWRLIWWSCVHQDVWFSVGMGRPMRINLDDCDTQLPVPGDSDATAVGVSGALREKYLPAGMHDLSLLFVELIGLAIIQANILSTHYRVRQTRPNMILACQGIVCIALVPPMQIHLLNSTSSKPLIATLGKNSLDMGMLVANELRKTYFGAELLHRLFSQAKTQIMNRKTQLEAAEDTDLAEVINLETPTPCLSHGPTQRNQSLIYTDTIRNLGSPFTGLEGAFNGFDFAMVGSNFDFVFPATLEDDGLSSQYSRWYPELPTENSFQVDETELQNQASDVSAVAARLTMSFNTMAR
ncbi:hypothetical protein V501_01538 [Pseudogymnoascus sp. VKM F-4519 (FW-2642)]|nr:hypothetical protein V501_01538 [Pseudogymnoascus sp. VKM F-4519 (FW-2642)]